MSFIGVEDDASVTCEYTTRSIRDYSENTQLLFSGKTNREDGNNNSKTSIRMVSYSEVQKFIFKNNNNIDGTCLNGGRLHLNKKRYSKFSPMKSI